MPAAESLYNEITADEKIWTRSILIVGQSWPFSAFVTITATKTLFGTQIYGLSCKYRKAKIKQILKDKMKPTLTRK